MKKNTLRMLSLVMTVALLVLAASVAAVAESSAPVIGISWSYATQEEEYVSDYFPVIEAAGGTPVILGQVTSSVVTYDDDMNIIADQLEETGMLKTEYAEGIKACDFSLSNVAEVLEGVDGVFFVGGEDISPTLFAQPQFEANLGEEINATRDVSDYTLMAYCLENDIPLLAACRGEQMLGIVSGCQFTQDITNYYAENGAIYDDLHRMPPHAENRTYARHSVTVLDQNTVFGKVCPSGTLDNVSSWHHQGVVGIEGTQLQVTAIAESQGITFIEGLERPDKTFAVGIQFHPENDVLMYVTDGSCPCDYDTCLGFFSELVAAAANAAAADLAA